MTEHGELQETSRALLGTQGVVSGVNLFLFSAECERVHRLLLMKGTKERIGSPHASSELDHKHRAEAGAGRQEVRM